MSGQDKTRTINKAWELPHAPAKVWRALTEPELIGQWLMQSDLRLELGAEFSFRQEPTAWWDGIVHSKLLEVVPQKRLSYTWGGGPGANALASTVTWTLSAIPGGTRLELEHTGFQSGNEAAFMGATKGWDQKIQEKLAALLLKTN